MGEPDKTRFQDAKEKQARWLRETPEGRRLMEARRIRALTQAVFLLCMFIAFGLFLLLK